MVAEVFCFRMKPPAGQRWLHHSLVGVTGLRSVDSDRVRTPPFGLVVGIAGHGADGGELQQQLYVGLSQGGNRRFFAWLAELENVPGSPVWVQGDPRWAAPTTHHVRVDAIDPANSGLAVGCGSADGVEADSRYGVLCRITRTADRALRIIFT